MIVDLVACTKNSSEHTYDAASMSLKPGNVPATGVLSKEVIALIHHVELHKDGWWDKATQRLVLAAIWLSSDPQDISDITNVLKS